MLDISCNLVAHSSLHELLCEGKRFRAKPRGTEAGEQKRKGRGEDGRKERLVPILPLSRCLILAWYPFS